MGWDEEHQSPKGARPKMVRTRNERVLLDLLREHGAMTRHALAEGMSLTLPAIAGITGSLSDAGLVREFMPEQPKGVRGRPPLMVEFLPESSFVIAVRLGRVETKIILTDALGTVKAAREIPFFESADYQAVRDHLVGEINQVIAAYPAAADAPKTLGLCVQGTLDLRAGKIVDAPRMEWQDVPLIKDLQAALSMPVHGIEAGRAAAVSELIEQLPLLVINADSFDLLNGPPRSRRQYLDWGVFHVEHYPMSPMGTGPKREGPSVASRLVEYRRGKASARAIRSRAAFKHSATE